MLHTSTVERSTLELLKEIMECEELTSFCLVGGTALSLQIGHRISIDLDLFTTEVFDEKNLLEILINKFSSTRVTSISNNCINMYINDIKVDFIRHAYKTISKSRTEEKIRLMSLEDITAMKINAICNRGSKKDFYDIYYLLEVFKLSEILDFFSIKYPNTDVFFAKKSIVYFENAELEPPPITIEDLSWEDVKTMLENTVK